MKIRCVYVSCIIALILTAPTAAQSERFSKRLADDNSRSDWPEAAEKAAAKTREQQALKLLDQVIAESSTLRVPENQIHVLAIASGIVWPRDEKRAREMLKSAAELLADILGNLDVADPAISNQMGHLFQVKSELFHAALNHDPAAALDFLRTTSIPGMADQEAQLEADAAWQLVNRDPKTALRIAQQALARGITGNLANIVSQLRTKDPAAAEQLASDILNKIQSEDLAANNQTFWLALGMIQTCTQATVAQADGSRSVGGALISPADLRSLVNKLVSSSVNMAKGGFVYAGEWQMARNALTQVQSMLPQIEKLDPQLSAKIAGQISQALQTPRAAANPNAALQNLIESAPPDDIVKAGESAPTGMRDQYYQQAAWKALNQGDVDKAAQIARQNVANLLIRQQILDQIEQRSAWQAMNDGKIDEARILIGRLRSREQRAQAFMNLAGNVIEHGDKRRAAELLEEARGSLPDTPESYYHMSLLINLAGMYSKVDPSRGIQIMNGIAGLLAKLIPAAEALQGFDVQTTFKDGEILMEPSSQLSGAIAQFAEQVGNLATRDYAGAAGAADTAGRPELRIMAGLSIASRILSEVDQNGQNQPVIGRAHRDSVEFGGRHYQVWTR